MKYIYLIVALSCLFLVACGASQVHKNEFIALGTYLEVISSDPDTAGLVYQEAKRLEKIFNIYDPDSELSRLNNTHNTSVKVSRELLQALLKAQEVFDVTGGVFDVSCGNLFEHWKRAIRGGDNRSIPVNLELAACGMDSIVIDSHSSSVTIVKEGVKIDMAGIAKGFIVDQCIELLKTKGINNALINAGGDLYCLGENNYKQWRIGLRLPGPLTAIGRIYELNNQAMATSGDYEQFFELDGRRYSHIIDPKSAAPVQGKNMSVSVIADSAAWADALATAFYILDKEQIQGLIDQHDLAVSVVVVEIDDKGNSVEQIYSPNFKKSFSKQRF